MTMLPKQLQGQPITNARERLVLTINPCDIKGAKPKDPSKCAAARALIRQGAQEAVVMRSTTYVNHGTKHQPVWLRYATPESLSREIVAIDRGGKFEPGDYTLRPVNPQRAAPRKTGPKKTAGKKMLYRHVTSNIR